MRKIVSLMAIAGGILITALSCNTSVEGFRIIHNNDGTDLFGNYWHAGRPLTLEDLEEYVDIVASTGVTTFMINSGSDFTFYRSKYSSCLGDVRGFDYHGDSVFTSYYRNLQRLETEGTDMLGTTLRRAKEDGMEAMITYRMNDIHFNDPAVPDSARTSEFWLRHPELWLMEEGRGWHADGAFDYGLEDVREQKFRMIAEQLDRYPSIDGYELDFMRFPVYFRWGDGRKNAPLMTELVSRVRAKVDSVSRAEGHKILLAVKVPYVYESCLDNGLDVAEWVNQGLVDFITVGVVYRGDPMTDVDYFRKESGVGHKVPIYACIDDGTYYPRETYSHGMMRGAASFALGHGADGISYFNIYFAEWLMAGGNVYPKDSCAVCRVRVPELLTEMCSLETLEGRNKSYSFNDICHAPENRLHYKTPLPVCASFEKPTVLDMDISETFAGGKPGRAVLIYRVSGNAPFEVKFNGETLPDESPELGVLFDRMNFLPDTMTVHSVAFSGDLLRHGVNEILIKPDTGSTTVRRVELILDYGDVKEHGWF